MARTYISWSCGHDEVRQLYGPNKDRDRYVEWAESEGLCPECHREVMEARREQERVERRAAIPDTCPAIDTGTEKQNAYAEDVRARLWQNLDARMETTRKHETCPAELRNASVQDILRHPFADHLPKDGRGQNVYLAIFAIPDHRFWLDIARLASDFYGLVQDPRTTDYLDAACTGGERHD